MLRKYLIIMLTCFSGHLAYCVQPASEDSLLLLIGKLNHGSFGIIPNYATYHSQFDKNAKAIIRILNKDSSRRGVLLNYLADREKVVAIHAILTKLYDSSKYYVESESIYAKEPHDINTEIIGDRFQLNGLDWEVKNSTSQSSSSPFFISPQEMRKIKKYWKHRFLETKG